MSAISFELHMKTAEEIDLEKCNIRNFGSSVTLTLTLTLDRVEVTLVRISGRGLPNLIGIGKTFCGRTYRRTDGRTAHLISNLLGHRLAMT